jgi:hypothetical protein
VWNLRLAALAQLDAQLSLARQSYHWLTDECETADRKLRESVHDYDGEWWTHDGWDTFNDARTVSPSLADAIEDAWDTFQESTGIDTLINDLREHSWIRPLSDFESNVRPAFEGEYIRPLYSAASWYDDVSESVNTVTGGTTNADEDEFIRATDRLIDTEPLRTVAGDGVRELQTKFDELQDIVGDRSPSEVTAIGLLPSDRHSLDAELERLSKRHDLGIERTESGVIVR